MVAASPRLLLTALGIVFGIVFAVLGFGWATIVLLTTLVGYYVGATLEGDIDISALLAPLRPRR